MDVENKCSRCQELEHKIHELEKMLMTDVLTGLPNKQFLDVRFRALKANFQRKGENFALAFLDIDHFKIINDTHGHDTGDQAILAFADMLKKSVRSTDVGARLQGDEFAVLLSDVNSEEARILMERIRGKIERISRFKIPVTTSVGVVGYAMHHRCLEDFLRDADRAMYRSKVSGRNAVTLLG